MNKKMKLNKLLMMINNSMINLPTPPNISYWWNFGSLLGMCLMIQIMSGLFLSMHYSANTQIAFDSIVHITRNVNNGWMLRMIHSNTASMFFICLYLHIGRGVYYSLFNNKQAWISGVLLMFLIMATAFMGYVLPWGQMSFWGATVITNLLSAIPKIGNMLVQWIWGGFAINNATLNRFLSLHFIFPFIIMVMMMAHLMFIHNLGSNNPMGLNSNNNKISFHPYYMYKDIMGFIFITMSLMLMIWINPYLLMDPDNFTPANPMITPIHIKPEWYFLFAYAILRSIPNKLGGVIALIMSISILLFLPMSNKFLFQSNSFYPMNKMLFWMFVNNMFLLTWIGASPVETPYILTSQVITIIYFFFFFFNLLTYSLWDKLIK